MTLEGGDGFAEIVIYERTARSQLCIKILFAFHLRNTNHDYEYSLTLYDL